MLVAAWVRAEVIAGYGPSVVIERVLSSTFLISFTGLNRAPSAVPALALFSEYTTSSTVRVLPSWNLTLFQMVKCHSVSLTRLTSLHSSFTSPASLLLGNVNRRL